jgi:hypothetical protein
MKYILRFVVFYCLFFSGFKGYAQNIKAVDRKGTIKNIENSKWLFSADGKSIYNVGTGLSVAIGVVSADGSAVLDANSTTKGFLPPRLTSAQRDVIIAPAIGLCIFNTTISAFEVNLGTATAPSWQSIADNAVTTEKIKDGTITTADLNPAATISNALNTAVDNDISISTSVYPTFVTANTGNLPLKTADSKLSFVPSTGTLSATSFTGSGSGLTGVTSTINANLTGVVTSSGNATAIADAALTIAKISGLQTAIDAKVADAINDATTTVAPSQNAVFDALVLKANLASPTFTGTPVAPTPLAADNTTAIATTAFVTNAVINGTPDATTLAKGKIQLAGELSGTAALPTVTNSAVLGKVLTGFTSGAGTVLATDTVLGGIQKLDGNVALKANLASPTFTGTPVAPTPLAADNTTAIATTAFVTTAVTNGTPDATTLAKGKIQLAGELSGTAALPTVTNSAVLGKVLTGFTSGAGAVLATDTVLGGIQKLDGNVALKANLASPTFTGVPTAPTPTGASTGTQIATTAFVVNADNLKANIASPTFTGVPLAPTAAAGTNTTQLATTAFVTAASGTNANLTGVVTSSGNATAIADAALSIAKTSGLQTAIDAKVADAINDATTTVAPSQNAVFDALVLKANLASPTFTGIPNLPTGTIGVTQIAADNTTAIATTAFVTAADNLKANIASPTFTGVPTAPTPTGASTGTQIATTAFVVNADNLKANIASPTFTGVPLAPTAAAGTNTTQLATTAFVTAASGTNANLTGVVTSSGNATAIADAALSIAKTSGLQTAIDAKVADAINDATTTVAPSQNAVFDALVLKANLASPTFTGTPVAPTPLAADNTTAIATTAFVTDADNLKANIASPTFTGAPLAPTAAAGTNTTQIATTAFVLANSGIPPDATTTLKGIVKLAGDLGGTADLPTVPALALKANLASPTFTGTPVAPTPLAADNTTAIATTAFVTTAVTNGTPDATTLAKGKIQLAGELSGTAALPTVTNSAVLGKVLTGFTSGAGTVLATNTVLGGIQKLDGNVALRAPLASPTFTGIPNLPTGTIGVTQIAGNSTTAISTTAFVTAADNLKANIASPTFTGVPTAPTATSGTNTTQIATTAFVLANSTITPNATTTVKGIVKLAGDLGGTADLPTVPDLALKANIESPTFTGTPTLPTGTIGVTQIAADNTTAIATTAFVRAADNLKANIAAPTFTGVPLAPTAIAGTNTTQLATTAFVTAAVNLKANIASPTFTGVPLAPTAAAGTNTTQIATTAFVLANSTITPDATTTLKGIVKLAGDLGGTADLPTVPDLVLKANLASPTFTGVPLAPTAISGTNTTQIATTAFVLANGFNIPYLEYNDTNKTIWNNGNGNITSNTSFGDGALAVNTTGANNVANGYQTLYNNTTGANNVANGYQTLYNNTTGNSNVANGYQALYLNTTGGNNTANGLRSLYNNTVGSNNVSNGFSSGRYVSNKSSAATVLDNSIMIGYRTSPLADNQTNQVVIGFDATGLGSNTSVIGNSSTDFSRVWGRNLIGTSIDDGTNALQVSGSGLFSSSVTATSFNGDASLTGTPTAPTATAGTNTTQIATTAFVLANGFNIPYLEYNDTNKTIWNNGNGNITSNTSFGDGALAVNTTGANNVANGYQTLYNNTTGANNVANGYQTLYNNTTGNSNVANGYQALYLNTTGGNNTANGLRSLYNNTVGSNNVSNGFSSGRYVSNKSSAATVLDNSIMIGYRTSPLADNQTNQVVIGFDATGLGSNTSVIGNSSTDFSRVWGRNLIGTSIDDGTNALQVSGSGLFSSSVTATSFNGDASLTGTPTAPTATAGTNTTQIATTAFVSAADDLKAPISSPTFTGAATITKESIPATTSVFSTAHLALKASPNPSTGGLSLISFATSAVANYGITIGSERTTTASNSTFVIRSHNNSDIGNEVYRIGVTGNSEQTGSVTATSFNGGASLTGTPTAPTAAAGTNTTQLATTAFVTAATAVTSLVSITIKTAAYTATVTDYTILCNAVGGGFTLTLPAPSASSGVVYIIRKTDETTNVLTFSRSIFESETTSFTTLNYSKTIRIQSNGTKWYQID